MHFFDESRQFDDEAHLAVAHGALVLLSNIFITKSVHVLLSVLNKIHNNLAAP